MQKVRDWFTSRNRHSNKGEENALYALFEHVADILPNPPRKPREVQFYSGLYWKEKIFPIYQTEMACAVELAEKEGSKKPVKINIVNKVAKQMWEAESAEVKAEVGSTFLMLFVH